MCWSRTRRRAARRGALLPQGAFAGRVRLRPRLGRRLRARRRPLLSEAPGRRALHAGDRPAPARRRRRPSRQPRARRCSRACARCGRRPTPRPSTSPSAEGGVARRSASAGFLQRTDQQFHWFNDGYATLRRLPRGAGLAQAQGDPARAPRRARPRHHRRAADRARHHGSALGRLLRLLHGHRLAQMGPALPQPALLLARRRAHGRAHPAGLAKRAGRYIAGAINFIGDDRLYGRNWGCVEDHPFLHFELCYYQAIESRSRTGCRVEAGAQGEHKLARGYRPVTTHSAHDIADPALRRAIAAYLDRERSTWRRPGRSSRRRGRSSRRRRELNRRLDAFAAAVHGAPLLASAPCPPTTRRTSSPRSCAANSLPEGLRGRPHLRLHGHHAPRRRACAGDPEEPVAHPPRRRPRTTSSPRSSGAEVARAAKAAMDADGVTCSSSTRAPAARWSSTCISTSSRASTACRCARTPARWRRRRTSSGMRRRSGRR